MKTLRLTTIFITLLTISPLAFSADASACMNCHDAGEFSGMSTADIVADLKDPGIPPHQRFATVSDEELQAIAAELAGD
jgi:hypothetical protein